MSPAAEPGSLEQLLEDTRQRFIATFPSQCDAIRILVDQVAQYRDNGPLTELTRVVHRLSGLTGTMGFAAVSVRARALEHFVKRAGTALDRAAAGDLVDAMQDALIADLAAPPVWAPPDAAAATGVTVLVAEDEADQQAIVTACLAHAGYAPVAVGAGDLVVETARRERPAVILLDIAMPGLDGYSVCRLLKADPELEHIPVIFMTTGANVEDKLAGLMLGADEFLHKPVDMRELMLRIQLLLKRKGEGRIAAAPTTPAVASPGRAAAVPAAVMPTAQRRERRAHKGAASATGPVRTVVIADADPYLVADLDGRIRAAGYASIATTDGDRAVAAVLAHTADVLVLDLTVPALRGLEVLRELRDNSTLWPRIIVLCGPDADQDVVRAFELGADDYVVKPFDAQELMTRIGRLVKWRSGIVWSVQQEAHVA